MLGGQAEDNCHRADRGDLRHPVIGTYSIQPQSIGQHELARQQVASRVSQIADMAAADAATAELGTREQSQSWPRPVQELTKGCPLARSNAQ